MTLVSLALLVVLAARADAVANTLPGCHGECGNTSIPYPFGIGDGCYRDVGFNITCSQTPTGRKPYWGAAHVEVMDISLLSGELRVKGRMGYDCYDSKKRNTTSNQWIDLEGSPFTFSDTRNKFTVLGCDTWALIGGTRGVSYTGGCISFCDSLDGIPNGTCSGVGCCQTPIPKGLRRFATNVGSYYRHHHCWDFNKCGYAFVVEADQYQFEVSDLSNDSLWHRGLPIVLDWSIGNRTCREVEHGRKGESACRSNNSRCVDSLNGIGYLCNCTEGYQGNPYLVEGCQDIDECASSRSEYPCFGICTNTPGYYNCTCPEGTTAADPRKSPCNPITLTPDDTKGGLPLTTKLAVGIGLGLFFLLFVSSCGFWGQQKRKYMQVKQKFFEQNGGMFLRLQLSAQPGCSTFKIYTEEELEKATKNFDHDQIIGRGGHGIVYKGTVEDNIMVAIKRSNMVGERQSKEFAREISILSQVNHKNVVKLLGCCLEVEVPILVYEFIPGGTLFDFIHHRKARSPISFDTRLMIAAEASEALAYLHSYASPPILHGDIKSSNILLDVKHTAKVSDFGASTLVPLDRTQFATVVQGTCGYLDPEYLQTCQLTEKSDVYSFGVVLAELLTGKKPLQFEGPEEDRSLALNFVSSVKHNRLPAILDAELVEDGEMDRLWEVAELTRQCLSVKGEDRPTMKEVAMALQMLGSSQKHPWVPYIPGEEALLLREEQLESQLSHQISQREKGQLASL